MTKTLLLAGLTGAFLCSTALAAGAAPVFNRIASFPVALNNPEAGETSSEIISASDDGMMLVYSDSPAGGIGFIDIADPKNPQAAGFLSLDGEPTSVSVMGGKVFVGVNTSESYANPSGKLAVVDLASKTVDMTCDVGGQPDSVAKSKDGAMIAVAIENERDEDLNDGEIPQLPAGYVVVFDIADGKADCAGMRTVDVTGLSDISGDDPEPEFVDFNANGEIALTMQENNALAVIDAKAGTVITSFSAGSVDLTNIDAKDNGEILFADSQAGRLREPDAIKWLDTDRFVIANEGDYNGGSRSFSIFNKDGTLLFDSGNALDVMAARLGHYPDKRSDAKGVEPEGLEVAKFGDDTYIFVLEERSSLVAVYKDTGAEPEYVQTLPSGISPEGGVAIPSRNLFVSANETDLGEDGAARSHVMIYELGEGDAQYPQIIADMDGDMPIGWVALSGMVADAEKPGILYAVSDSFLGYQPSIYTIDATAKPARIVKRMTVTRGGFAAQKLDLEGITLDGKGGFWLASEGRTDKLTPHALYNVNAKGEIKKEVAFPDALLASEIRFGTEGITAIGEGDDMVLWIAMQREWKDDPKGQVKLLSYTPKSGEWGAVRYPLDAPAEGAWVGLSEITAYGDNVYILERDNQIGEKAVEKKIYSVPVSELKAIEIGGEYPVVTKTEVRDLIPDLLSTGGYVLDKVESLAIDVNGEGFVATDNDGVDDSSGETMFWSIGAM